MRKRKKPGRPKAKPERKPKPKAKGWGPFDSKTVELLEACRAYSVERIASRLKLDEKSVKEYFRKNPLKPLSEKDKFWIDFWLGRGYTPKEIAKGCRLNLGQVKRYLRKKSEKKIK